MTTARKGGENEADTHSIDGAWTAGNLSKAKQHQRGPGSKRKGINDQNRLKSGTPTTKHRLSQRMKRNGGREKQYASKQIVGRQSRQDDPGKWTHEENKGFNSAFHKANHLLQGAEDPSATELQCIPTESGLETVKPPLKNLCRKIYSAHCIIQYTHSTYTGVRRKKKKKESCTVGIHSTTAVRTVCAHYCVYNRRRKTVAGRIGKKSHLIIALCNHTNTVTLSDMFHTILGTEKSNLDNNFFLTRIELKRRASNYP